MKDEQTFLVTFPSPDDFFGRQCASQECKKYFRIHGASLSDEMFCPYCGELFKKDELFTKGQIDFALKQVTPEILESAAREIQKAFSKRTSGQQDVSFKPAHIPRPKRPDTSYQEPTVDSELTCPQCEARFQVDGIFGFCPKCKLENILVYDANVHLIEQEIASAQDQTRALRHAYSDLVSAFESFCRQRAGRDVTKNVRFQNLKEARKFFLETSAIDIFDNLPDDDLKLLRRVFLKRHVHEHNGGIIGDRYIREVPEDKHLLGLKASLSLDEFKCAAAILHKVLSAVVSATTISD